ncbi:MAG: HD-GYP domain-containing protein [Clostridia bacterium]
MRALINITDFQEAYDILAGSKYYYEIMNNINRYIRNIKTVNDLENLLSKNPYILSHGKKVEKLSFDISESLGLDSKQKDIIRISARYHDSAFIFFPQEFQSTLNLHNESQLQALLAHPYISAELVGALFSSKEIFSTILSHHEFNSGCGYPYKLKSENISIESSIIGIVDFYLTLTEEHQFFNSLPIEEVIMYLDEKVNILFSEEIFYAFLATIRKELKHEEIHFVEIDRKITKWREKFNNKSKRNTKNIKKNNLPTSFENTLKNISKEDKFIQRSII